MPFVTFSAVFLDLAVAKENNIPLFTRLFIVFAVNGDILHSGVSRVPSRSETYSVFIFRFLINISIAFLYLNINV